MKCLKPRQSWPPKPRKPVTVLCILVLACAVLHLPTASSASSEVGYINVDENSNVVISAPNGFVILNGMDVVSVVNTLSSRVQQLEGLVARLNVSA